MNVAGSAESPVRRETVAAANGAQPSTSSSSSSSRNRRRRKKLRLKREEEAAKRAAADAVSSPTIENAVAICVPKGNKEQNQSQNCGTQREGIVGTLRREENTGTLRREESIGTLRREESTGTLRREESIGTQRREESIGTQRREESIGTLSREESMKPQTGSVSRLENQVNHGEMVAAFREEANNISSSRIPNHVLTETGKDQKKMRKERQKIRGDGGVSKSEEDSDGAKKASEKVKLDVESQEKTKRPQDAGATKVGQENGEAVKPGVREDAQPSPNKDKTGEHVETVATSQEEGTVKSKSQLRAERRAKQEAQRAAKAERMQAEGKKPQPAKNEGGAGKVTQKPPSEKSRGKTEKAAPPPARTHQKSEGGGDDDSRAVSSSYHQDEVVRVPSELRQDDPQQVKKKRKRLERQNIFQRMQIHKKVALFSHLPQYQIEKGVLPDAWKAGNSQVHSAFYRVGVQMAYGRIMGANNRCMALAEALTAFIDSFHRPEDKEFGRYLESQFSPNITFLSECRPLSAGMRTFVKNFKAKVLTVGREDLASDDKRKQELKKWILDFIEEKITLAGKTIAKNASGKISDGSCLLTFSFSSTVAQVFRHARHEHDLDFTVIVADCEPMFEGRRMVRFLESAGIPCEYASLTGVASVMSRVSAVFIGAQAIFNNGSVLSRAGTGLVASIAEEFHRPLHVCCESYKFWERVQLDAFVYNELGDPGLLIGESGPMREEWENPKSPLHYLNPLYDVTPPELIDIVVTELCLMPSSSVPVVLRRHAI